MRWLRKSGMRWLRRGLRLFPRPDPPAEVEANLAEARAAREESEQAVAEIRGHWPEVRQVTGSLREHRRRNNFRPMFKRALELDGGDK